MKTGINEIVQNIVLPQLSPVLSDRQPHAHGAFAGLDTARDQRHIAELGDLEDPGDQEKNHDHEDQDKPNDIKSHSFR